MPRGRQQEPKVLTLEEKKQKAWDSFEIIPKFKSFGAPTYTHNIGDKVRIGNLQNCVVDEVKIYNGDVIYGVKHTDRTGEGESYIYDPWYSVRPYEIGVKNTTFTQENDIDIRFYNTNLDSLLNKFYLGGVDMNPSYQRDYVWDDKDKEALLDSIFNHIEIGKFAFIIKDYSHEVRYEILDGKQRLSTLLDFYENRLAYKGVYYNELSGKDRFTFLNTPVTIGETSELSKDQIYKYFYVLNKTGKVMDEAHLEKIKEQLEDVEDDLDR
jgi:hypothetical protein